MIVKNPATQEYKTGSYRDLDPHGLMSGGKARSIAAAELSQSFPGAKMVALSTLPPKDAEPKKPLAEVTVQDLKHYGVEEEKILLYEDSYSTLTELMGLISLAVKNSWKHVVVITNEYHTPRAQLLLEKVSEIKDDNPSYQKAWEATNMTELFPKFKELNTKVTFVSAETVLPIRSRHYSKIIEEMKKTDAHKARVKREKESILHLHNGTYGKNPAATFIPHPKE